MTLTHPKSVRLDSFLSGYLEAAMWTEEEQNPGLDSLTIFDADQSTLAEATRLCHDFETANAEALDRYYELSGRSDSEAGHDLWLTRNGHGAGFWDRVNEDSFPELCAAAEALGEAYLYLSDDGDSFTIDQ